MPTRKARPNSPFDKRLDRAVDAYCKRMAETKETFAQPTTEYWEPVEAHYLDIDEQIAAFEYSWSDKHFRYDAYRMQQPLRHYDKSAERTVAIACGVFVWDPVNKQKLFDTQQIVTPFDHPLNVSQWRRLIQAGLFKRTAHWVWIPSVQRLSGESGEWSMFHVHGWRMISPRMRRLHDVPDSDVILTADGQTQNYKQYLQDLPKCKGQLLYVDITTSISHVLNA